MENCSVLYLKIMEEKVLNKNFKIIFFNIVYLK